jgi:hypothetical protein
MTRYYLSRVLVALAFGALWVVMGSSWLAAGLAAGAAFALFVLAPRSGLYAVRPELGVTAMADDERTRAIRDKAARIAFVATMLGLAGLELYFRKSGAEAVPLRTLDFLLVFGVAVYWLFNTTLRRT